MKNFKETVDGLTNQVIIFLASALEEKEEALGKPGSIFIQLVQVFSILLESIEYKVIEDLEQIKQILSQVKPVTEFLRKNKYIDLADKYCGKAVEFCDEFKFDTMKDLLNLSRSTIDSPIKKSITEDDFKIDKNIQNLSVKLHSASSSLSSFPSDGIEFAECKNNINQLMIEFTYLSNLDLMDTYKNPQQCQIQQATIERIIQVLSRAENNSLVWNFVYFIKNKTSFKAKQNSEWHKKILCFLFFRHQNPAQFDQ